MTASVVNLTRRGLLQGAGLAGLGLLAGCARLPGQVEPPAKMSRIGLLSGYRAAPSEAFWDGLREHGYVDGQNIVVESRWSEGVDSRIPDNAAELVQLPVDILVAGGPPQVHAARDATTTIPIVMAASGDPVRLGLVTSLARPGGNITGLSFVNPLLELKRLDLLKETIPGVPRVAVLWNAFNPPSAELLAGARAAGLHLLLLEVRGEEDLEGAFDAAITDQAGGLFVHAAPYFLRERAKIVRLAAQSRLATMYERREFVEEGGLMTYSVSFPKLYRRAAYYVDRILKGAKPADLPIEQPREFEFVINLQTAQALGLTIPPHVLLQATEVIQ
jgi:putative tryptophan/tyrosine transport system substrate-binding protein